MLDRIAAAAREAGRMMLKNQNAPAHQKNGHYNFVTDTDVAVQDQ